jgi:hypothetical protein
VAYQSGNTLPTSFELAQFSASDALLGISPRVTGIAPVVSVDGFNRELVTYTNVVGSNIATFSRRELLPSFAFEQQVNPSNGVGAVGSANASSANGTSVVVWVEVDSTDTNILAQRYNKNGAKVGPVIQVDVSAANSFEPTVAMDAKGNFVVAWTNILAGGDENVLARAFSASGSPRTAALTVAGTAKAEFDPDVAASNGSFVVAYTLASSGTNEDIHAHRYTVTGGVVTDVGDFTVVSSGSNESRSSVAMAPSGAFDVAYQFAFSATDDDIRLNRYSAAGSLLASGVVVSGSGALEQAPDIAMDNAGNAVVVYQEQVGGDFDIKARRVSSSGVVGSEINVRASGLDDTNPSVALAPTGGQFVVAYGTGGQIEVAEVSATDSVKAILGPVAGSDAVVSIDGLGRYEVTYSKIVGVRSTIFKRRDFLS